jgi:dienelactone hydrolase
VPFTNHVAGTGVSSQYELRLLEIPSIGDNGQQNNLITAKYYRSTLSGRHPLVIVLPIWGSYTYPPRKFSSMIQHRSSGAVHVLHVQGDTNLADWSGLVAAADESEFLELWRKAAEHQRVTIVDVRRLIDWAEKRSEIDTERIGLIGCSLGAVVAGTIATQEPRLAATVTVMGGSHLHSVLAYCDGKRTTSVQEKAESFGWSREKFEARLEPIMSVIDAANYPDRVDPRTVLIIEANRDKCVPEKAREDFWLALGKPERISMNYDHEPAFYSMTPIGLSWMRRRIWEFLEPRLLE